MSIFLFFGLLWTMKFIDDKVKFIAMSSAASYYFDSSRQKEGSADVCQAIKWAYTKHPGSLAFGSFCMTLISFVKFLAESLETDNAGGITQCLAAISKCLLCCIESIADYFGKVGYAYMAVTGESFCTSAWNGFLLNMKHGAKFFFAVKLANMFISLGIISICCLNCAISWLSLKFIFQEAESMDSMLGVLPSLLACFTISLITAMTFLGLFDEAVL